jgi:hypothetical protein
VRRAADRVDQRHARLTGPAQDLHLRLEVGTVGPRAVGHVEDARAREHGRSSSHSSGIRAVRAVLGDERLDHRAVRDAFVSRARIHSSARARAGSRRVDQRYSTSPSTRIGYVRHTVVVPGSGAIRTESSCASVATMLDLPLLG